MAKKHVIVGQAKITAEKALLAAKKIVRDETVMLRVTRERKSELEKRAKRAGVSLSSYLLQAEDKYAHIGTV
jgi:hypothetical protein